MAEEDQPLVTAFLPEALGLGACDAPARKAAETEPAVAAAQVRRAIDVVLTARARRGPLVVVIDDAQHADEPTMRALVELVRGGEAPILVLALATRDLDERFPHLFDGLPRASLRPLDCASAEALVRAAVGPELDPRGVTAIVEQAEGLPFHLEELARAQRSGDANAGRDSVLSVVESRIARLGAPIRRVLRAASVFGERFDAEGVRHLLARDGGDPETARALLAAVETELILAEEREGVHRFRHRLVREAAYAMLTEEDRALGHRLAASWIEESEDARAAEIAAHYASAGRAVEAARWYAEAAGEALRGNDLRGALLLAERGLSMGVAEGANRLACTAAQAQVWLGRTQEALASAERAMEASTVGSHEWLLAAGVAVVAAGGIGDVARVREVVEALLDLEGADDEAARVVALTRATNQLFFNGLYELAHRTLARLESALEESEDPIARGRLAQVRGVAASHAGDTAGLIASMRTAAERFEEAGDRRGVCVCRANLGAALLNAGLYEEAEGVLRELLDIVGSLALGSVAVAVHINLAQARLSRGHAREALAAANDAAAVIRGAGDRRLEGVVDVVSARARLMLGELDEAEEVVGEALDVLAGVPGYLALALAVRSQIALARGDVASAVQASDEAMAIVGQLGALEEGEAVVRLARIEALLAAGREDDADADLREALSGLEARARAASEPLRDALRKIPEHARLIELGASRLAPAGG